MALLYSTASKLGAQIPSFDGLVGADGRNYGLKDFDGAKALLVMFMCNHCPYVIAVQDRIASLAKEFMPQGLGMIGINSNDPEKYPDDSLPKMKERVREAGYIFPYVQDSTQDVARAFDAVCTPDPYLFGREDGKWVLKYRGRIDDSWKDPGAVTRSDLKLAIAAVLAGQQPNPDQLPSMGCSIKWKSASA